VDFNPSFPRRLERRDNNCLKKGSIMQHTFQLTIPLAFADVTRIGAALMSLPGVGDVKATPGSREVQVWFDEGVVSLEALARTAARAGYHEMERASAGGCCGGCCGG
jgi:copper chaperone CopZ